MTDNGIAARLLPSTRSARLLAAAVGIAVAGATGSVTAVSDTDSGRDLVCCLSWVGQQLRGMTLPVVASLLTVSVLHHLAASAAARVAADATLPWLELVGVQYAAAAANRVTPAGLGAAGVTGRYMTRRGHLTAPQAAAAVSALAMLGGVADVAALGCLIGLGAVFHLTGAAGEAPHLVSRLVGLAPISGGAGRWLVAGAGTLIVVVLALPATRRHPMTRRARSTVHAFGANLLALSHRPLRILGITAASGATTLLLAAGFASSAIVGPANVPASHFAALMIGYMLAAAAVNAVPTPGAIGTADAALTGVLLTAHVGVSAAVATVVAYRLLTFWAPSLAGFALLRTLRCRGAL